MRILQICTSFYAGGIQRHLLALSASLRENGHEVFLAGAPGTWLNETSDLDFCPLQLKEVTKEGGNLASRLLKACTSAIKLREYIRKNRIELIHAHESAPLIVAKLASLGLGIPLIVTYHGSAPERVRSFGYIGRLTAQLVLTPSHHCASDLHQQAGIPKKRLKVIGLGVEIAPDIDEERVKQHRKGLLGSDGRLLVIIIARLAYQKGIDTLVEVVRLVQKARSDIKFVVIGDGPMRNEVEGWPAKAGVDSLLKFDGESSEPYLYLKAADLFLLTSRWEALPIAIVEAFRVGLPVVATDTGGVRELVTPSVGRVESVGDTVGLSASVLEICNSQELRLDLGRRALELSKEARFSIPHIHRQFEEVYADILEIPLQDRSFEH